jgi:hypothetical protein
MDVRANPRSTALWGFGFAVAYLVLAAIVSLLADNHLHLAAWLPVSVLWLASAFFDGAIYASGVGVDEPRPPSPSRQARIEALRWLLCVLALANAALLLWRAVSPGGSTLVVAGVGLRLLPLDVRLAPTGVDPLPLALGVGLGFLGLCELRLRLTRATASSIAGAA